MTPTVTRKNQVTLPASLVAQASISAGFRLDWSLAKNGELSQAAPALGAGRPNKASGLLKGKTHFLPSSRLFLDIEGLNSKTANTKQIPCSATEKALFGLNVY